MVDGVPGEQTRHLWQYSFSMAAQRKLITAADMDKLTPQQRADAVDESLVRSWDDVPEPFRSEVLATARQLGERSRPNG